MKRTIIAISVCLMVGCAARPYEATTTIYDRDYVVKKENSTIVRIHRLKQLTGSGLGDDCPLVLKVDDKEIAGLQQNQYVDVYLPNGKHELSVRFKCALTAWKKSVELTADGNKQEYQTELGAAGQYRMWRIK